MDEWAAVNGYDGVYEVSRSGEVKSLSRVVKCGRHGKKLLDERMLTQCENHKGYMMVYLCKDGKEKMHFVHRLVANAFIDNPLCKPQVNHKDGDKKNNHVDNLEWVTNKENSRHAVDTGLLDNSAYAWKRNKRVVALNEYGEIEHEYACVNDASMAMGVWRSDISRSCRTGRKVRGLHWSYKDDAEKEKHMVRKMRLMRECGYRKIIKQIKNGELVEMHPSILAATRKTGVNNISACLNGKRMSSGGFKWEYATDDEKDDFLKRFL